MFKRAFDVLCAALGLLILLVPGLLVAAWVKLDSPGPVFFRQERVGRGGRLFRIHKFRTMRVDAPSLGPQITIGADPRITRSGQWLRASKVDELPQLLDVLRGEMSLVGPRPEVPRYVALYPAELRERVLSVRPGITDPASLSFRHESELLAASDNPEQTYVEQVLPQKLQLSADYIRRATLGRDLVVILQTLRVL
ncbi:sugar transferase [Ideonella paludis]|uniref:Sugar transferase n=1 Tax=Ideonella paludis TaxID=1233411 RepID=A0ABS5DWT1_9BURK|nr:sugar transferase [Ideonella paludis]MBQ0935608.1 sugar transferase [Ideonella paludis]